MSGLAETGLAPPDSVKRATDEYLAAEDMISAWIEDCCIRDEKIHTGTRDLFESWKYWAVDAGHYIGDERWLAGKLADHGFRWERHKQVRGYWGLQLAAKATPQRDPNLL
jgi:putative DNA primase/helicase